jgi:murein L,D-transpeptidase YcbB/YkuD
MTQNNEVQKITLFGYSFSLISFIIFVYILFFSIEKELKQQAFYWFASSFVAVLIPNVKQFKFKDLEVQLQEISQKIENNKTLIEKKAEELNENLFLGVESVRKRENSLSEAYKQKRNDNNQKYAEKLNRMSSEERLKEQKKFTCFYLHNINKDLVYLKKMLQKAGFYNGATDEKFDEQIAQSISRFQEHYGVKPIDGIAGPQTLSKLGEIVQERE